MKYTVTDQDGNVLSNHNWFLGAFIRAIRVNGQIWTWFATERIY